MGEKPSARTERELADLRASLDVDLQELRTRLREDVDPRRVARRQPVAVFGTLGSMVAVGLVTAARGMRQRRLRHTDNELDAIIARLGGRVDKLGPKAQQALFTAVTTAVTAALTLVARRFASRLVGDEELPEDS